MNERVDNELSAATRQLIADARGVDDPSAEDEARVKARWLATIAAGAGVTSLTEAARAAAGTGWGLKVAGAAAAMVAAGTGLYLGWTTPSTSADAGRAAKVVATAHRSEEPAVVRPSVTPLANPQPPKESPVAQLPAAELPVAQLPAAELPSPERAPTPEGIAPAASRSVVSVAGLPPASVPAAAPVRALPAKAHVVPERARVLSFDDEDSDEVATAEPVAAVGGQLGEEIALLSRIRASLQAGAALKALQLLGDYQRRFDRPNLAMEADALHVDALCEAGQRDAAREQAAQFVVNWPGSPLEQRVRAACPAVSSP